MTLAELKARIIPGTKLTRVHRAQPDVEGQRTVTKVNEFGFYTSATVGYPIPLLVFWPSHDNSFAELPNDMGFVINQGNRGIIIFEWGWRTQEVVTHAEF